MPTKKIPISFNEQDQANLGRLIDLMGITDVYGDIPKAVKFGINLALAAIEYPEKVYCGLNTSEMEIYFSSVVKLAGRRKADEKIIEILKSREIV